MYKSRTYRKIMEEGRFKSFIVKEEESDLWIGLNNYDDLDTLKKQSLTFLRSLRLELKNYIGSYPEFLSSHEPIPVTEIDSANIREMKNAAITAYTGPMASVAGLIAEKTLHFLEELCPESEIIVENGGDLYLKLKKEVIISPFAGKNSHFAHLGFEIFPDHEYLAVCASSGMFGHSFSYGKADLVVVFAEKACLADAWATSIANKIIITKDVNKATKEIPSGAYAILGVKDDKMAYKGNFPIVELDDFY